ncbi:MAG: hypothetical protein EOM14_00110, partial [Clostridia bacterium]|nr:hypothetical protein [Clostridia bacterium]
MKKIATFWKKRAKRYITFLLVSIMIFNCAPLEIFAYADFVEHVFSGGGTITDPYILENEQDFMNLGENIANVPYYSLGKYFIVSPNTSAEGSDETRAIYFSDDYNSRVCLGGLGGDPAYYFYGNMNLNNTTLYTSFPIFGTISDGASVYMGYIVLSEDGTYSEIYDGDWGGLAQRIISSGGQETGDISFSNIELSVDVDLGASLPFQGGALGGMIGSVQNDSDSPLTVTIDTVELVANSGTFAIRANHGAAGGVIGELSNGSTYDGENARSINVQMRNVTVDGVVENACSGGVTGGFIGRANVGCEISFGGATVAPDAGLLSGDSCAMFIGEGNQALAYTNNSFSLTINGLSAAIGDDLGIDTAKGCALFGGLDLAAPVSGAGTAADPYLIADANDLMLLAAAVNTVGGSALACFTYPGGISAETKYAARDYLRSACYQVTDDIDLTNCGFMGVGYYVSSDVQVPFSGAFSGTAANPIITLQMNTDQSYLGLFPLLYGATVSDITVAGDITTSGTTVGAVAAMVGAPGQTENPGVTITAVDSAVNITASATGSIYIGGLIGRACYSDTDDKTAVTLTDDSFSGKILSRGSYVGGMIGAVESMDQGKRPGDSYGLDITIEGYTYTGVLQSQNAGASNFGGCVGGIISTGSYTDYNNSSLKPRSGFAIIYNTTKLEVSDCTLNGTITVSASGVGGFAASMSGVDADFENISVGGAYTCGNGMGGLAQNAGGCYRVNGFTISDTAVLNIRGTNVIYSGLLFGNSSNAWTDVSGFTVASGASISVTNQNKFDDLTGYTFFNRSDVYPNGSVQMGGMLNVTDETSHTPVSNISGNSASDQSRHYYGFTPAEISGSGSEADPFVIDTAAKLQTLSVFNYLTSALSWMLLDYFPDAGYPSNATDVDKVMYLKTAHYVFTADIDLTGVSYYPMPIIGGSYEGQLTGGGTYPTITFAGTPVSAQRLSAVRENQSGLFTSIVPYDLTKTITISGLNLTGTVAGAYYPAGLAAGYYKPNDYYAIGMPGITAGRLDVSYIGLDSLKAIGGSYTSGEFTNGRALLAGYITGGVHAFTNIEITLPDGYSNHVENNTVVGDAPLADALIGRVTGDTTMLELQRVAFPATYVAEAGQSIPNPDDQLHYFGIATFISQFDAGSAYYYYDSYTDLDKYAYVIDNAVMPASRGSSQIVINPPKGSLDRGYGTAESPFIIDSPDQLYALATAISNNGETLGGTEAGRLQTVNGYTITDNTSAAARAAIIDYLLTAHYRVIADIDFSETKLTGYKGIGSLTNPFAGTFDGRGHTITLSIGDNISETGAQDQASAGIGLFKYIMGADILNLHVTTSSDNADNGVLVTSTTSNESDSSYNGLVAAIALGGDNVLDNVIVSGKITVNSEGLANGNTYAGGYIGHIEAGTVSLINLPEYSVFNFKVYAAGSIVAASDSHYASICPSVKDGYVLYDGDDPSTSVYLSGDDVLSGKVNEYMSTRVGTASGGGSSYEYSLVTDAGENLDTLPDIGITLTSDGVLQGYPQKAGTFKFTVRVKSTSNTDSNYVTYDAKEYTLIVERAEYPTLVISTDLEQISYAMQSVDLEYANFPRLIIEGTPSEYTAVSDATLEYEIVDNPGVVEIVTNAETGTATMNIVSTGTATIRVTKPVDDSYNSTSLEFTLTVQKADLWLSVDGAVLYYGALQLPTSLGDLYIEGLRGHYDGSGNPARILVDSGIISELAALGITEPTVQIPTELQSQEALENAEIGTYRLIINSISALTGMEAQYEDTLSKYNIRYRHGLVQIIRKIVQSSDYDIFAIAADGSVDYSSPITSKTNGRWYNHGIVVRPSASSGYTQISGDGGATWSDELRYTGECNMVIAMHLRNGDPSSGDYGITTDDYDLYVRIDKTVPSASISYAATQSGEPLFGTELDKTVYGGVYKNPFTISMAGADPQSNYVASGIRRLEYLVLTGDETLDSHTSAWNTVSNNTEISINGSASGGYYLRVVDYAGNESPIVWYSYTDTGARPGWFVMDSGAPTIGFLNSASFSGWRKYENGIPDLSFTVGDDLSGLSTIRYAIDGGTAQSFALNQDGTYTLTLNDKITSNGTHTVVITAKDRVGNTSQQTLTIQKDSNDPVITLKPQWSTPVKYTQSKTFTVAVSGTTPSGINSVTVTVGTTAYDITGSLANGVYTYTAVTQGDALVYTVTVTKNARLSDGASYVSASETIEVPKIDSTVPILTVTGKAGTLSYADTGAWTASDVVLTFLNNSDTKSSAHLYAYEQSNPDVPLFYNDLLGETTGTNPLWIMGSRGAGLTNTYNTTKSTTYCFRLVSEAGVMGNIVTFKVSVDKTKPVITDPKVRAGGVTRLLNTLTAGLFFNEAEIIVPATDIGSGIANVKLTLTPTAGNGSATVMTNTYSYPGSVDASFTIGINFRGYLSIVAADRVGNTSDKFETVQDIIVDGQAPVYDDVVLSPTEADGIWTKDEVYASLSGIADGGYYASGINRLDYWRSEEAWNVGTSAVPSEGVTTVTTENISGGSYTFHVDFPDDETEGTPNGSYYLITAIYDNAGNKTVKSTLIRKDSMVPKIAAISIGNRLTVNEDGDYVFKTESFAKPGDQIRINLETRVSPQKIIVTHEDTSGVVTSYGEDGGLTVAPSGDMYADFTIPSVDDPNGTYTFVVFGGNGNAALPDGDTAAGHSVALVTTTEIDPDPPQIPVIDSESLDYYGNGEGEDYRAVWLRDMADIDVSFMETRGATEWLEYAVKSGVDASFEDADFIKVIDTDASGNPGSVMSCPGAVAAAEFSADGAYTVAFRTADGAGRVSGSVFMLVLRDTTAPEISAVRFIDASSAEVTPYTPKNSDLYTHIDALFGQQVFVQGESADNSADDRYGAYKGTVTVQYAVTDGAEPDGNAVWLAYTDPVDVLGEASEFSGSVWFRASDEAGNATAAAAYTASGKLLVNTAQPTSVSASAERVGGAAPTDEWSPEDVLFTLSGGTSSDTVLDQYQYAYKAGSGSYGSWTDFPNGSAGTVENTLTLDADFAAAVNGIITVIVRAVSHTGVTGPEYECAAVYKDDVAPDIQVSISGKTGTSATPNCTNAPVVFTLANAAANTSPVTYSVTISGVNGGEPIALTTDGQVIQIYSDGMVNQGTAVWDEETKSLTFSGDILNNNAVSFTAETSAGKSDSSASYYVSIQQSTVHLQNAYVIGLDDLSVSEQPLGLANSASTPIWCNQWYNSSNIGYPTVYLTTPADFHHAYGAPVYVHYTLKNTSTNATTSGSMAVSASYTSDTLFAAAADGKYTFDVWTADAAGNASAKTSGTLYIDRTAPTGVNIGRGSSNWLDTAGSTLTFKWFSNDYATQVNVSSNTNVAGAYSYAYIARETSELTDTALSNITAPAADDTNWQPLSATAPKITLPNQSDDFMGMLFVRIVDKAGNVTIAHTDGIAVEDGAPTADYTLSTSLPSGYEWYDTNPTFSISAADNETVASGISTVTVYEVQNGSVVKQTALYTNTTNALKESYTGSYTTSTQGEFTTYVVVKDRAGNQTTSGSSTLKVDAADPVLTVAMATSQGTYTSDTWTNRNVTVTLSAAGYISGISYYYSEDSGATWNAVSGNTVYIRDDYYETVIFKAQTLSGRSDTEQRIIKVQKNMPGTLTGFLSGTGGVIFSLAASNTANSLGWRNTAFDVTISAPYRTLRTKTDGQTRTQAPVTTYYTLEKKNSQGTYETITGKSGAVLGGESVSPIVINISEDGNYRLTVYARDEASNETTRYVVEYQLDSTAPDEGAVTIGSVNVTKLLSLLTFNLFYKNDIKLTVTANYNISGKQRVEYMRVPVSSAAQLVTLKGLTGITEGAGYLNGAVWQTITTSDTVFYDAEEFIGLYFIRLTDCAGNKIVFNSDGVVIDLVNPSAPAVTLKGSTTTTDPSQTAQYETFQQGQWYQSVKIDYTTQDSLSGINRIEIYHHYTDGRAASLKQTLTHADLAAIQNELGFYNRPYSGSYLAAETGVYSVEIRVYDEAGGYSTTYTNNLNVDNAEPVLTVAKKLSDNSAWPLSGEDWTGWVNKTLTFTLSCKDTVGGAIYAPVTYWYKVGSGEWTQIQETATGSGIYEVAAASGANENTNASYYFRALVGTIAAPTWTAYENGRLAGSDEEPLDEAALENAVKIQKTPPDAFADADFALYLYDDDPESAELTEATLNSYSEEGWYDRYLTVEVSLPRPMSTSHAPMTTSYELRLDGALITDQSGVSGTGDDHLFFQLAEDGIYTITVRTTDYATNTNSSFTKTIKVDASDPALGRIMVGTLENAAAAILERLSYGLFFKHVTVDIGVSFEVSGRHTVKGLYYQLASGASGSGAIPQPTESGWISLTGGNTAFTFQNDFQGVIYVKAMDKAGNQSVNWVTNGLISDYTAPSVTVSATATGAVNAGVGWTAGTDAAVTTDWLNADTTITIDASDLTDSVNTLSEAGYTLTRLNAPSQNTSGTLYSETGTIDPENQPEGMDTQVLSLTENDVYTLTVTARDRSGNVTTRVMVIKIDKSAPAADDVEIMLNGSDVCAGSGTPESIYITGYTGAAINAGAASVISGVKKREYQIVPQGGSLSDTWAPYSDDATFASVLAGWENKTYNIHARITDNAGNVTAVQSHTIYMDTVKPTVSVAGNAETWTDSDVTLTVTAEDCVVQGESASGTGSGLHAPAYRYTYNGSAGDWTDATAQTYAANGTVIVEVRDNAGNINTQTIVISKIDKLPPDNGSIQDIGSYTASDWYNESRTITASFAATEGTAGYTGCGEWLQYRVTDVDNSLNNTDWIGTYPSSGSAVTIDTPHFDQGTTTVEFRIIDEMGRIYYLPTLAIVNLDTTAPAEESIEVYGRRTSQETQNNLRALLEGMTLGWFFNENLELTIQSDTAVSGEAEIKYYLSRDETAQTITPDSAVWDAAPVYDADDKPLLPVSEAHRGVVYVRVTDNAGNMTVAATQLVVVDAAIPIAPTVTAHTETGGNTYTQSDSPADWVNENVVFDVEIPAEDQPTARIERYEYAVLPQGQSAWSGWETAENSTVTMAVTSGDIATAAYKFRAVSYSGMESEETVFGNVYIDKAIPAQSGVTIQSAASVEETPDPATWYKDNTLTVTVPQDAGSPVAVWYKTSEGGVWTPLALTDNAGTIALNLGVNNIWVLTKDGAGNCDLNGSGGRHYLVLHDDGVPALTVTPTVGAGEAYTDGGYTNQTVTFEIQSSSVSPFYKIEISDGADTLTLIEGAGVTVERPSALGGLYVASCTYTLPADTARDTDLTDYTVKTFTHATDSASDTAVYGQTQNDPIACRFDGSAPVFGTDNITYEKVNSGALSRVFDTLTFGLFFKEAVVVRVSVDALSQMAGNTSVGSSPISFTVSETDSGHNVTEPDVTGGNGAYTATFTVPIGFIGDISMYAEDSIAYGENNRSETVTLEQFVADTESPALTLAPASAANENGWYREDIGVSSQAADPLSGMYSLEMSENSAALDTVNPTGRDEKYGQLIWQKTYDATGIYEISALATDNAGNETASGPITVKLDKTMPTVSVLAETASVNPYLGAWTTEDVTLAPSAANLASVISGVTYYYAVVAPGGEPDAWVTGGAIPASWTKMTSGSISISGDTNKDYYFAAISGSGIVSALVKKEIRISASQADAPALDTNGYTSGDWVNTDVALSLSTGEDNTPFGGTAQYQFSIYNGTEWSEWGKITDASGDPAGSVTGSAGAFEGASYAFSSDIVQTVKFRTVSNSGVASLETQSVTVMIDKTKPVDTLVQIESGEGLVVPDPNTWYDSDHLVLTIAQSSDWAPVYTEYSKDGGTSWTRPELPANVANMPLALGVNSILVRTVDGAGNYSAAYGASGRLFTVLYDSGLPVITVTPTVSVDQTSTAYDGGYTSEQVTYTLGSVSVSPFMKFEVYLNGALVDTITTGNGGASVNSPAAGENYIAAAAYQPPRTNEGSAFDMDAAAYQFIAYTTATQGGTTPFGQDESENYTYNYDKSAPQFGTITYTKVNDGALAQLAHTLSFGIFFSEAVVASVPVNNAGAGTATGSDRRGFWYTPYGAAEQAAEITEGSGNAYTASFTVNPQFKGDIVLRAADTIVFGSDNETTMTLTNFVADTLTPSVSITPDRAANLNGWYNADIGYTAEASDTGAGLRHFAVVKDGETLFDPDITDEQTALEYTETLTEDGIYVISASSEDNAGNFFTPDDLTIRLDKTSPAAAQLEIEGGAPNGAVWYTSGSVSVTIAQDLGSEVYAEYKTGAGSWLPLTLPDNAGSIALSDGVNTVAVRTCDLAGNYDSADGVTYTIKTETTVPAAPTYTVSPETVSGTWTNARVVFAVTGEATAPVTGCEYSTDGGENWSGNGLSFDSVTETGIFTVPAVQTDGTDYIFRTLTASGKISAPSAAYTVRLDTITPAAAEVTIGGAPYSEETWYTADKAVVIAAQDDAPASEVHAEYKAGAGAWLSVPSDGITLTDGVNTFLIRTADQAGNFDTISGTEYTVHTELTVPTVSAGASVPSGVWTNGEVTFNLSGTATAPITGYEVSTDGNSWSAAGVVFDSGAMTGVFTTAAGETASTSYYFRTVSASGKRSVPSFAHVVKIDMTEPVVGGTIGFQYYYDNILDSVLHALTGGTFFGTKIKVRVSVSDSASLTANSGVDEITYTLAGEEPVTATADEDNGTSFYIDSPYTGGLSVLASDTAGNVSDTVSITGDFTVDTTVIGAPVVSVSPSHDGSAYAQGPITYSLTNSATMNAAGVREYQYNVGGTWYNSTQTIGNITYTLSQTGTGGINASLTVGAADGTDQTGTVRFRALSGALIGDGLYLTGAATGDCDFSLDRVKPVISEVTGGGSAWQQSAALGVNLGTTPVSGAAYQYSTDGGLTWQDMPGNTVSVNGYFDGIYTFRVISGSGVESDLFGVVVKVSDASPSAPEITVNGSPVTSGSTVGWTNDQIVFSAGGSEVSGFAAGFEGVDYYEVKIGGGEWEAYTENGNISISTDTNTDYAFRAISVSGVEGGESSVSIRYWDTIDDPEIAVTGDAEEGYWYKAVPSVAVTAALPENNGLPVTTSYILTANGTAGDPVTLSGAELVLSDWPDGEYTLTATAADEAGNISSMISRTINVDTVSPVIQIAYSDSEGRISETSYYNSLTTVTLEVVEKNPAGDYPAVTVTKDGAALPQQPAFTTVGDNATASCSFMTDGTDDGVYTVSVSCTDLAGNSTVKTADFTLDTVSPVIDSVTWRAKASPGAAPTALADGAVSLETMAVAIASADVNSGTVSWTLSGITGTNAVSGSVPGDAASFDIISPFSGTLTITVTDMAGNATSTSRTFTVDSAEPDAPVVSASTVSGTYAIGTWTGEDVSVA